MYSFYYNDLLKKCGRDNIELLFTDTGKYLNMFFFTSYFFQLSNTNDRERKRERERERERERARVYLCVGVRI